MGFNLGAFAQGIGQGWKTGTRIADDIDYYQKKSAIDEAAKNGLDAARSERENAITGQITGGDGLYMVAGKTYTTPEEARAAAGKNVESEEHYYANYAVPKMRDTLLKQGRVQEADAFHQWGQELKNRDLVNTYGKALTQIAAGDHDNGIKNFGKYYGRINDGVEYDGHELVKNDKGDVTGYAIKLRDRDTGQSSVMNTTPTDLLKLASAWNPLAFTNGQVQKYEAANSMRAKIALGDYEAARANKYATEKDARGSVRDVTKIRAQGQEERKTEAVRSGNRITEKQAQGQIDVDVSAGKQKAKFQILKDHGYTDQQIKEMIPSLMDADPFKRGASPQEAQRQLVVQLSKDPMFARKTPEEQQAMVNKLMASSGYGSPAANGLPSQKPAATSAPAATSGLPFYDVTTGKTIYR